MVQMCILQMSWIRPCQIAHSWCKQNKRKILGTHLTKMYQVLQSLIYNQQSSDLRFWCESDVIWVLFFGSLFETEEREKCSPAIWCVFAPDPTPKQPRLCFTRYIIQGVEARKENAPKAIFQAKLIFLPKFSISFEKHVSPCAGSNFWEPSPRCFPTNYVQLCEVPSSHQHKRLLFWCNLVEEWALTAKWDLSEICAHFHKALCWGAFLRSIQGRNATTKQERTCPTPLLSNNPVGPEPSQLLPAEHSVSDSRQAFIRRGVALKAVVVFRVTPLRGRQWVGYTHGVHLSSSLPFTYFRSFVFVQHRSLTTFCCDTVHTPHTSTEHRKAQKFSSRFCFVFCLFAVFVHIPLETDQKCLTSIFAVLFPGVIFPSPFSAEEGAVRLAIDEINNNTRLLPNHMLQYDSTTGSANQGLEGQVPAPDEALLPDHTLEYIGNHTSMLADFTAIQSGRSVLYVLTVECKELCWALWKVCRAA